MSEQLSYMGFPTVILWQRLKGVKVPVWKRLPVPPAMAALQDPMNGRTVIGAWIEWGDVNARQWDMSA